QYSDQSPFASTYIYKERIKHLQKKASHKKTLLYIKRESNNFTKNKKAYHKKKESHALLFIQKQNNNSKILKS
ncbi:hypothetical protein, partial [Myroides odoratus]|uniref:hypothetical protein n=1 Tax=Myroides odoratus TaxID=256 RepID=UPI003340C35D